MPYQISRRFKYIFISEVDQIISLYNDINLLGTQYPFKEFFGRIHRYVLQCFFYLIENHNNPNININFQFSDRLSFVPNSFKITIFTRENTYKNQLQNKRETESILQKVDRKCSDNLVYRVPWSFKPILVFINYLQTVSMIASWGDEMAVILDEIKIIVKPGFKEYINIVDGLFGNMRFKIHLKQELFILQSSFVR